MNILVFPATVADGMSAAESAQRAGNFVLGAASIPVSDTQQASFSAWAELPFVTDPEFQTAFASLITQYRIEAIHAPHPVVWTALQELLPLQHPNITLLNDNPCEARLAPLREAEAQYGVLPFQLPGLSVGTAVPPWLATALSLALPRLPGQSPPEKLALMLALAYGGVAGDLVEIGSLWGRSAWPLALASTRPGTGPLLCIDPWQASAYQQPDSNALLAAASDSLDAAASFRYFIANLAPFAGTHCNYIRGYATEASDLYRKQRDIHSEHFGTTRYTGRIALLHIDGNHDYKAVVADIEAWSPLLQPGGWLIIDDYCWPFGDGPRRAADAWHRQQREQVDCAFHAFGSLWLRLKS